MKQEGHLQTFELVLNTRSPLYIGSGQVRTKTEYLFYSQTGMVQMLNMHAFFELLMKRKLADSYEQFVLSGHTDLYGFLKDCGLSAADMKGICLYEVDAKDALKNGERLMEIHTFQRNAANQAYIPGSSLKGALRTVLLSAMVEEAQKGQWPNDFNKNRRAQQMATLEGEYLNTLNLKKDKYGQQVNDAVNSIMRGISVSDSQPISDKAMVLAGKFDAYPSGNIHQLNLCRECIKPGTTIAFRLTLDQSVLKGTVDKDYLMDCIAKFVSFYEDEYLYFFKTPREAVSIPYTNCLILGGGSGFFAKNLAYPWLGERDGLAKVQEEMVRQFKNHYHEKDAEKYNISPHMMKYAKYLGKLYPYGLCEVSLK